MTFKEYSHLQEAKFRESLPDSVIKQIEDVAELYFNYYNSDNQESFKNLLKQRKISKFSENKAMKVYFDIIDVDYPKYFALDITTIKVFDLETKKNVKVKVHCIYGDVTTDYASYIDHYRTINIFDENLKGFPLSMIKSKILHEVTHAFQEYKLTSSEYNKVASKDLDDKSSEDIDVYFTEPVEFDAHTNEIAFNIREKYKFLVSAIQKAQHPETKRIFQNKLQLFFQQMKVFIFADPKSYFDLKELVLPDFLIPIEEFLESIKKHRSLWNKMKNKMINLYKELATSYNQLPEDIRFHDVLTVEPRLGVD